MVAEICLKLTSGLTVTYTRDRHIPKYAPRKKRTGVTAKKSGQNLCPTILFSKLVVHVLLSDYLFMCVCVCARARVLGPEVSSSIN